MSDWIDHLLEADNFFNRHRGVYALRRLEDERFTLTQKVATGYTIQATKPVKVKVRKARKVSTSTVKSRLEFQQWQIELAVQIMKGKK